MYASFIKFTFICVEHLTAPLVRSCPKMTEVTASPRAAVIGSCVLPDGETGKGTVVLERSTK